MSPKLERAKAELIDRAARVVVHADGRLDGDRTRTVEDFVRRYWQGVAPEDLLGRSEVDVYGAALAHWDLARHRQPGTPELRVYNPDFEQHGWQTPHTVVEVVTDDMPFLVDSVSMAVSRAGAGIQLIVHPLMAVQRDGGGRVERLVDLDADVPGTCRESFMHVEIDRQTEPEVLQRLEDDLRRTLADVRAAVSDWGRMVEVARGVADDLAATPSPAPPEEVAEARALLEWMADHHFTFLGYREYELVSEDGGRLLRAVPGSGLGIMRGDDTAPTRLGDLAPEARQRAADPHPLVLTKANAVATVHRPAHLDYVGVKRFDADGRVVGERRFVGLYTAAAYSLPPSRVPLLRRKVAAVMERADLPRSSHVAKDFMQALETYPRDELFQIGHDDLYEHVMGIVQLQERRRVRVFLRRDDFGRFVSCLVYLPRDRYTTETRLRIQQVLLDALAGTGIEFSTRLTESVLARLHFVVWARPGAATLVDAAEVASRVSAATRTWEDELHDALVEQCGEEEGVVLARRYGGAFPPGYRDDYLARAAVPDIRRIEALASDEDLAMSLYRPLGIEGSVVRLKLYRSGSGISLSDVLPLLQDMGVTVVDERPYLVEPAGRDPVWVYDFGLVHPEADFDAPEVREVFQAAVARVWRGDVESDGFNRLVLGARLGWRDVSILRAYARYLRQAGTSFSQSYIEEALAGNPVVARLLVELFRTRFEPDRARQEADRAEGRLLARLEEALDAVESLDEDRILRSFLRLVRATLRTNAFQHGRGDAAAGYLAFKLDPRQVPELPEPRPTFEIFVYAPWMEGVHLRAGRVARGGIRWSDRREDFRTEVLGLMKAQMVKNAVIVPVGAKGGFVVKRPPAGDRTALLEEVERCYRTLIHGMLDLTDNLVAGEVVPPERVVRYDDDDPYLVVAADKGTATFSDMANGIAAERRFWLGDAFASGGSTGYDHKAMGITARGAWESVKRHFRALGVDVQSQSVRVVGIGDMSGDVFGNGVLLSPCLQLVAAFDHRHVFLDPDPDPEASFAERQRLAGLPRSSWADYDPSVLSAGGGVFPRTAKSIPLSEEVRRALDVSAEVLTPNELIRAILRAPVDLLWNGGIGTFVKAAEESNAEVGDKSSDAIRVDARDLRCRVVGEGGNLGFTQRARVEYALGGGRIYTDAIDNSAGVDTSDHEVNIKILLNGVVDDGDMTVKQRNELLAGMSDEVAALVLRDNYEQTQAIDLAAAQAPEMLDVHVRCMRALEQAGQLDRRLEALPDDETVGERRAAGAGLAAPELAVLLAYAKIVVAGELLESDVPEDPFLCQALEAYFPSPLRQRFRDRMQHHRLRRDLVATAVANRLVNGAGISAAFRLGEETSASTADIARAYTVAQEVFAARRLWEEVEALDGRVAADVQVDMLLESRRLVERAARWLLRNRRPPMDVAATVDAFADGVRILAERLQELLPATSRGEVERRTDELVATGVPVRVAARVAGSGLLVAALDVVEVARATQRPVPTVGEVYFALGERLELDWLRQRVAGLPRENRWQTLARAALRDDLAREHAALAAEVLRSGPPEMPAVQRIDAWLDENATSAQRALQVLAEVRGATSVDLATLSVALREIRNITQGARARV